MSLCKRKREMKIRLRSMFGLHKIHNLMETDTVSHLYEKIDSAVSKDGLRTRKLFKDVAMSKPLYKSQQILKTMKVWYFFKIL